MTVYFLLAASLVILTWLFLLPALLRSSSAGESASLRDANIAVARERMTTLRQALADGSIDQSRFDQEQQTLERELGQTLAQSDGGANHGDGAAGARPDFISAIVLLAAVPIAAGALCNRYR